MRHALSSTPISEIVLNDTPLVCDPALPVGQAARLMAEHDVGSLVVMEAGKPAGIFTERDFLKKVGATQGSNFDRPVREFMTPNPRSCPRGTSIDKVMAMMRLGRFRHLLINDEKERFIGVLSIKDVMNFVCDKLNET